MCRPLMDVNGEGYQALLWGREMYRLYGRDYKDMIRAEAAMGRIEKNLACGEGSEKDRADFLRVKAVYARVFAKMDTARGEMAENHTTTHYVWRTQGDDRVRGSHAANEGEIFSWSEPPDTGHPGEEMNCRCWAEPTSSLLTSAQLEILNRNAPPGARPEDLQIDPRFGLPRWYVEGAVRPTVSPLDFVGVSIAVPARLTEGAVVGAGRAFGRQFLSRQTGKLTEHGALRVGQRLTSVEDINVAVKSAMETGKITRKIGQYGTFQYHYEGKNGLRVILEAEGRNAGKVITTFWKGTKGK